MIARIDPRPRIMWGGVGGWGGLVRREYNDKASTTPSSLCPLPSHQKPSSRFPRMAISLGGHGSAGLLTRLRLAVVLGLVGRFSSLSSSGS